MRTQTRSGFTIVEVILFLAITGALTVAILVGSGAAINRQRYRDSVNTFKGLVQEQYGQVANVVNSNVENPICTSTGSVLNIPEEPAEGNTQPRGTSDCLVVGRFLLIRPESVTVYSLIGQPDSDEVGDSDSDSETLASYAFTVHSKEEYEMSWGTQIVEPRSRDGVTASVAIVRSPRSGSILTYIQDGDQSSSIAGMMSDGNMQQVDFCIDPDRGPVGSVAGDGRRLAIRIKAYAANQSAIEIPLESERVCDE